MKLRTKTSLVIVATGVLLFLPLSSIMVRQQERALRKAAYNTVDSVARHSALLVSQFIRNAQQQASLVAAGLGAGNLRAGRLGGVQERLRVASQGGQFGNGFFILDAQGRILRDYPPHPGVWGRSVAYRDYFRRTLAEHRGVMSKPYTSIRTGQPVVTFTAPILDSRGRIAGVAAGSFDLLAPNALGGIQTLACGRTGYTYIFDRSRLMIIHPDPKRVMQRDIPPGANPMLDRALDGFEGAGETVNSRGVPMLLSFRRIPGTSWILAAQMPQAEAFEPIASLRRVMLVTTAFSILVILGVGVLMVRYFARPLDHLHRAASAITRELEAGSVAPEVVPLLEAIRTRDETGGLARAFKGLVERQRHSLGLLKQAASEWERTFDAVQEAVLCLDQDGRILRLNRTAALWFRVAPEAAVGRSGRDLVTGGEAWGSDWPSIGQFDAGHAHAWTGSLPRREGQYQFQALPVVQGGTITGMILSIRDCTLQAQREEDFRKRAFFDDLTGLPNRALLMDRLQQVLASAGRAGQVVGVFFLDLDRFKEVNDTLGHDVGDGLLREVAARLNALVRRNDTVARLGGDEFVIVVSGLAGPEQARRVAAKVVETFAAPFQVAGHTLQASASVGVALAPGDGSDGDTLLKRADSAMYEAKREGRNGYRAYSELAVENT